MKYSNEQLLNTLEDAIVVVDAKHQIEFINDVAKQFYGVSDVSNFVGFPLSKLLGENALMNFEERDKFVKQINNFAINPFAIPKQTGPKKYTDEYKVELIHFFANPIIIEEQTLGFIIKAEIVIKQWTAFEFIVSLGYETALPIQFIRGFSELLLLDDSKERLSEQQIKFIESIQKQNQKLYDLRESILDFQKQYRSDESAA